jgi:CheY-like chemotaxis protein
MEAHYGTAGAFNPSMRVIAQASVNSLIGDQIMKLKTLFPMKESAAFTPVSHFHRPSVVNLKRRHLARPDSMPAGDSPLATSDEIVAPLSSQKRRRILIVDDDSMVRGSLAAVLESEGYEVEGAANGRNAVVRAIAHPPDVVLLDLNMPDWDGWTAFTQLDRVMPLLPVIVITARSNQYTRAVHLGVDAFMEKPLNIPVLLRAIEHLTSEDADRHLRRITNRSFVTLLLGGHKPEPSSLVGEGQI